MEQNEVKEYRLLYVQGGEIKDNGSRYGTPERLRADFPDTDQRTWTIIPADEVPANWREMTVEDGMLVPASAEVILLRQAARVAAETEAVRAARESRYRSETDRLLYDALEAWAAAHAEEPAFAAWLEAKDRIRQELPKPQEGGGE